MKFDIKNILICMLLIISVIFCSMWYFKKDKKSDYIIEQLHSANNNLQKQRDSLDLNIKVLNQKFIELKKVENTLLSKISNLESDIAISKSNVLKYEADLKKLRSQLLETKNKIKNLEENPANRTGQDLLDSIKNKTKK